MVVSDDTGGLQLLCPIPSQDGRDTRVRVEGISIRWMQDVDPPHYEFRPLTLLQSTVRLWEDPHHSASFLYEAAFQVARYLDDGSGVVTGTLAPSDKSLLLATPPAPLVNLLGTLN